MKKYILSSFVSLVIFTGCSFSPPYSRPEIEVPDQWEQGVADSEETIDLDWWRGFECRELDALMSQALERNNDIRGAIYRIRQSHGMMREVSSTLFPYAVFNANDNLSQDVYDEGINSYSRFERLQFLVSYEADLFGKNSSRAQAARERYRGSIYDYETVRLVILSEVAKTYFIYVNAAKQVEIVSKNLEIANEILEIIQTHCDMGISVSADVSMQKIQIDTIKGSLAAAIRDRAIAHSALAVLVGVPPVCLEVSRCHFEGIDLPSVPLCLPAQLLERRPDIRKVEAELKAANGDIGEARAAFYPNIVIGLDASTLSNPAQSGIHFAGSLMQPIFESGRLQGKLERVNARRQEIVENYRKAVLNSFREVENGLASAKAAATRLNAYADGFQEATQAIETAQEVYLCGASDYLDLLQAQKNLLQLESLLNYSKFETLSTCVDLYKALGGGWYKEPAGADCIDLCN